MTGCHLRATWGRASFPKAPRPGRPRRAAPTRACAAGSGGPGAPSGDSVQNVRLEGDQVVIGQVGDVGCWVVAILELGAELPATLKPATETSRGERWAPPPKRREGREVVAGGRRGVSAQRRGRASTKLLPLPGLAPPVGTVFSVLGAWGAAGSLTPSGHFSKDYHGSGRRCLTGCPRSPSSLRFPSPTHPTMVLFLSLGIAVSSSGDAQ